jgi:transglutaminase-like putative cysteine protease
LRPALASPKQSDEIIHWPQVARVVHRVEQRYEYRYTEPVRSLKHHFRVVPRAIHGNQRLLDHNVAVQGATDEPTVDWTHDDFGNPVCLIRAAQIPEAITFDVTYHVERFARHGERAHHVDEEMIDLARFAELTPLTTPDEALMDVADRIRETSPWQPGRAYRAFHWAAAAIVYQHGITNVATPAAAALAGGAGVCQDYSHLLLTVLRLLGIPARYVSGHLLGEGAPHAWVEALFADEDAPGGVRVVPYDPTNRVEPGLRYVAVAVGRDYRDVAPTTGSFIGRGRGELHYRKRTKVVEVEYRDPESEHRGAGHYPLLGFPSTPWEESRPGDPW